MWIPKEIGRMATRLKEGHRVNRITVRELLRMFKAERRGLNKVHDIRTALDSLGLVTDPDFESVWIDGKIRILLKNASSVVPAALTAGNTDIAEDDELDEDQSSSVEEQEESESPQLGSEEGSPPAIVVASEGVVETVLSEPADPTFRIGSLPAANKNLTTVGQDDTLKKA